MNGLLILEDGTVHQLGGGFSNVRPMIIALGKVTEELKRLEKDDLLRRLAELEGTTEGTASYGE